MRCDPRRGGRGHFERFTFRNELTNGQSAAARIWFADPNKPGLSNPYGMDIHASLAPGQDPLVAEFGSPYAFVLVSGKVAIGARTFDILPFVAETTLPGGLAIEVRALEEDGQPAVHVEARVDLRDAIG